MSFDALNMRLSSAAGLVRQGALFADIGTDHAFLPLFLLSSGRIDRAYCADINEGPLRSARKNAEESGLSDKIEFVLTDGAGGLDGKNITDYAICGMGGELIARIIENSPHLKNPQINLILGPMSKQDCLRRFLAGEGYDIKVESYSYDSGKYYVCFLATYTGNSRIIGNGEAELGSDVVKCLNKSAKLGYLKKKLSSYQRALTGKEHGGENIACESEMIGIIEKEIEKLTAEM